MVQTGNTTSGLTAQLLSDLDDTGTGDGTEDEEPPAPPAVCTGDNSCTADTHNPGCPMKTMVLSDDDPDDDPCTGEADCPAQTHDSGGKSLCDGTRDCTAQNHKEGCLSQ